MKNRHPLTANTIPTDFFIPGIEANVIVLVNGIFRKEHCSIISPSSEINILNLNDALGEKASVAAGYIGQYADVKIGSFYSLEYCGMD